MQVWYILLLWRENKYWALHSRIYNKLMTVGQFGLWYVGTQAPTHTWRIVQRYLAKQLVFTQHTAIVCHKYILVHSRVYSTYFVPAADKSPCVETFCNQAVIDSLIKYRDLAKCARRDIEWGPFWCMGLCMCNCCFITYLYSWYLNKELHYTYII